jgi:hypothetical protein
MILLGREVVGDVVVFLYNLLVVIPLRGVTLVVPVGEVLKLVFLLLSTKEIFYNVHLVLSSETPAKTSFTTISMCMDCATALQDFT